MSDVFISYAREDARAAKKLADMLSRQGHTVFWDHRIEPGTPWEEIIERELKEARCVVVLWSRTSVGSAWVKAEAEDAANRSLLVPVLIEQTELPLRFRSIQAANLVGWDQGEPADSDGFLQAVGRLVNAAPKTGDAARPPQSATTTRTPRAPLRRWRWRLVWPLISFAALLALAGGGYQLRQTGLRKGWWTPKLPYFTFLESADGLSVGAMVTIDGKQVGEITQIELMPPQEFTYSVFVSFLISKPYCGYVWTDSHVRVRWAHSGLNRILEVSRGQSGEPTFVFNELADLPVSEAVTLLRKNEAELAETVWDGTNLAMKACSSGTPETLQKLAKMGIERVRVAYKNRASKTPTGVWDPKEEKYVPPSKNHHGFWLNAEAQEP
jgi:hypothetical protein